MRGAHLGGVVRGCISVFSEQSPDVCRMLECTCAVESKVGLAASGFVMWKSSFLQFPG